MEVIVERAGRDDLAVTVPADGDIRDARACIAAAAGIAANGHWELRAGGVPADSVADILDHGQRVEVHWTRAGLARQRLLDEFDIDIDIDSDHAGPDLLCARIRDASSARELECARLVLGAWDLGADRIWEVVGELLACAVASHKNSDAAMHDRCAQTIAALIEDHGLGSDASAADWLCHCAGADLADVCAALIRNGVSVDARASGGWTPLMCAASSDAVGACRVLIAHYADVHAVSTPHRRSALMEAAAAGSVDACRALVGAGASVRATCSDGWCSLTLAARNGHESVCTYLIREGADPHTSQLEDGATPLMVAVRCGRSLVAHTLLKEAGVDVNATRMTDGATAMMVAAVHDQPHLVHLLKQHGARVDDRKDDGYSALDCAARAGHIAACTALLDAGADVDGVSRGDGRTALQRAVAAREVEVCQLLVRRGADVVEVEDLSWLPASGRLGIR